MEDIEMTIKEMYKVDKEHAETMTTAENAVAPCEANETTAENAAAQREAEGVMPCEAEGVMPCEAMPVLNMSAVVFYDDKVEKEELRHTYWLRDKQLRGVTGTLIRKAFPDMYKGIDKVTLMNAADRGNGVHDMVQQYLLFGGEAYTAEEKNAADIVEGYGLRIIDTEYLVSDEKDFASAVDLVALDRDGDVVLIDIKTTSERHYDAVSLQLSIYAEWFERQNPTLKVKGLWLMWLRDDDYRYEQVPRVDKHKIKMLTKAFLKDVEYEYEDVPKWLNQRSKEMSRLMKIIEDAQTKLDALKETTLQQMSDEHWYSLKRNGVTISKVAASQSSRFNSAKLKKDDPELYERYLSMTVKKEYLTLKRGKE